MLHDLAEGKVDIIVGTHKLVGKTVKFHDLGLLIIDEEQKFGVAIKEKLRQLKVNIDTLTMTATPHTPAPCNSPCWEPATSPSSTPAPPTATPYRPSCTPSTKTSYARPYSSK